MSYAQQCLISENDINTIIKSIKNNKLNLSPKGFFFDLRDDNYHTTQGNEYADYIKKKGIKNVMFETDKQYQIFIKYLELVKNKPCDFLINEKYDNYETIKKVYLKENKKYTLYLDERNKLDIDISLNITEGNLGDEFYDERSYIYSFEKKDGDIYFYSINPVG